MAHHSYNNRVFLPSQSINIFPCSRRGQANIDNKAEFYDPEARLNTERTNRIGTAINGFTDSFIESYENNTLVFVLAGYRVEIKNFEPSEIADALNVNTTNKIYAHLSIHDQILVNSVSIDTSITDYYTELLYRQATSSEIIDTQSLDVKVSVGSVFTGISFVSAVDTDGEGKVVAPADYVSGRQLLSRNLLLFTKSGETDSWVLEQTSLLPKIAHDEAEDSIVVEELHVRSNLQVDGDVMLGVIDDTTGKYSATSGTLTARQVNVPYEGSNADFQTTEIKNTGISTAYVRAGEIKADGLAVGNTITIVDDQDRDADGNTDEALTTIGKGYVSAVDELTVPNIFTASARSANKVIISAVNGLEVTHTATVKGATTIDSTLEVANDTSIQRSLSVGANINIGDPDDPATVNDGGYVVAKNDITAEHDLIAKHDILVEGSAAIAGNLDIGTDNDTDTGIVNAKKLVQAPTLKATAGIETPELKTNAITSDSAEVTVNKKLKLGANTSVDEDTISTLTVETEKITSKSTEIVVDKVLKVDTINSDSTNGLTIKRAAKLENTLTVEGATTVNDTITAEKLIIPSKIDENGEEKGEVVTPTLRVNRLTTNSDNITVDDKNLIVTKNLEVLAAKAIDEEDRETAATATIDKAVIGQLEVKADTTKLTGSTGKITAKEIAAEKITQNGNTIPTIKLIQNGTAYQLQITRDASKK